ncbi:MAG: DUF2007 domain-containing protein [Dethiobacter sp.]|jgi:hypothetical protein|nr:DUF2007 domain-containing protein [Dethiobacter sp.]
MADQWELLVEVFNDVEADLVCGLLQSAGIPCRKEDSDTLTGAMRVIGGQAFEIQILVPERLLKQARDLLISAKEGAEG